MAVLVVDLLEVVDVAHDAADGGAACPGFGETLFGLLHQRAAVKDAGERIARGQQCEFFVLALDLALRGAQLAHGHLQPLGAFVQFGHVGKSGQATAHLVGTFNDGGAVHH